MCSVNYSFSGQSPITIIFFFFSSRRRHTRSKRDWSSDVCSSDLGDGRNFCYFSFPKENVNQRFRLLREQAFLEQFPLSFATPLERKLRGSFNRINGCERSHQIALLLACVLARSSKDRGILLRRSQLLLALTRSGRRLARYFIRKRQRALQQIPLE